MFSKIRFAVVAASLFSTIAIAPPAMAASHARHTHVTVDRNVRAQDVEGRPSTWQAAPADELLDYPHVFCCS